MARPPPAFAQRDYLTSLSGGGMGDLFDDFFGADDPPASDNPNFPTSDEPGQEEPEYVPGALRGGHGGWPGLAPSSPSTGETATVIGQPGVNVRESPSAGAPTVSANDAWHGTTVSILDWDAAPADRAAPLGWARVVTPGGSEGYATKASLSRSGSPSAPQPTPSGPAPVPETPGGGLVPVVNTDSKPPLLLIVGGVAAGLVTLALLFGKRKKKRK